MYASISYIDFQRLYGSSTPIKTNQCLEKLILYVSIVVNLCVSISGTDS